MPIEIYRAGKKFYKTLLKSIAQPLYTGLALRQLLMGQHTRGSQGYHMRNIFSTGSTPRLLTATIDDRFKLHTSSYVQRADTLGGIELVPGNGQQIDT